MNLKLSGRLLMATGWLHTVIGLLLGAPYLREMWEAGVWNSVDPHLGRMAIFWFLMTGFLIVLLGEAVTRMQQAPRVVAWGLLVLSAVGAFMMPVSGFWLVIPQAGYLLWGKGSR